MGTTSEKLTYLNGTKTLLKDVINYSGAGITSETTFRNYVAKLYDGYVDILKNKYVLLDNMPKGQVEGISTVINNAEDLPVYEFKFTKESTQETNILPSGYTQVDYIESSGLERINTGVNAKGTLHVSIEFETATELQGSAIFGGRTTSSSKSYCFWSTGNDTFRTDYNNEARTINVVSTAGKFLVDKNRGTTTIKSGSNIYTETQTNSTFTSEVPITLFACNSNGSIIYHSSYKLYKCDIYDNDVLVRQFIPCYRNSDNEVGLYDLVNDVFYTNQGTGAFSYRSVAQIPNPDYPQEVNVVEGYRNLFDKDNANIVNNIVVSYTGNSYSRSTAGAKVLYINIKPNTTYTISKVSSALFRVGTSENIPANNVIITNLERKDAGTSITLTSGASDNYLGVSYFSNNDTLTEQQILDSIQIVEGDQELPYVPYGNNYIAVNVSDGTNTNKYPIPLNNNIIAGIGDYKDELKVDKTGHVYLNKKTGKMIFDGINNAFSSKSSSVNNNAFISDEITNIKTPPVNNNKIDMFSSHFIASNAYEVVNNDNQKCAIRTDAKIIFGFGLSSTLTTKELANTWLSSNNVTTYYPLATPELIDLQTTVDINLFKGVNNISNSEDGLMNVEYVKEYEEGE